MQWFWTWKTSVIFKVDKRLDYIEQDKLNFNCQNQIPRKEDSTLNNLLFPPLLNLKRISFKTKKKKRVSFKIISEVSERTMRAQIGSLKKKRDLWSVHWRTRLDTYERQYILEMSRRPKHNDGNSVFSLRIKFVCFFKWATGALKSELRVRIPTLRSGPTI